MYPSLSVLETPINSYYTYTFYPYSTSTLLLTAHSFTSAPIIVSHGVTSELCTSWCSSHPAKVGPVSHPLKIPLSKVMSVVAHQVTVLYNEGDRQQSVRVHCYSWPRILWWGYSLDKVQISTHRYWILYQYMLIHDYIPILVWYDAKIYLYVLVYLQYTDPICRYVSICMYSDHLSS